MKWRTRVKVCGLTRTEDIHSAVEAGVDAIGLVFYPKSSRLVALEQAERLRREVPALVSVVALFVNAAPSEVQAVIERVRPDVLQFHGEESPVYCDQFGMRYMKAFRVGAPGLDTPERVLAACQAFPDAAAWLFDSYSAGYGGSGLAFDPALIDLVQAHDDRRPIVLAGGMRQDTVQRSIELIHPYAVDVSSGVEVSGGIKSAEKIREFMLAVKKADEIAQSI